VKRKVYLSKSNKSDQNTVRQVRSILKDYDVEVHEFPGGTWDAGELRKCDTILMVPPLDSFGKDEVTIGKGQYTEIEELLDAVDSDIIINDFATLVVSEISDQYIYVDEINDIDELGENNFIKWADLITNGAMINLLNYFDLKPNVKIPDAEGIDNKYYDYFYPGCKLMLAASKIKFK